MRDIKFRAWAEKTVDNRFYYAYHKAENKDVEPRNNTNYWDEWYENTKKYRIEFEQEWDKLNNIKDRYSKERMMITDFSVNGTVTAPYGFDILDIMQFTGLQDKNGVEVYEGDIVDFEDLKGEIQRGYICYRAGSFRISNKLGVVNHTDTEVRMWYDGNNDWYSIENLGQMDIKVIGNIHQNSELLNQ